MADSPNENPVQPRTRQELYDHIRETSREEFTLDEMIRLGFWPSKDSLPVIPDELREQDKKLSQELNTLVTENKRISDQTALLKQLRKQQLEESRKKQQETKLRREQERLERTAVWKKRKEREILYLGEGVSGGLNETKSDAAKLTTLQLPHFPDALSLAQAMQIPIGELRFLAYARAVSKTTHYRRFYLPKKTGGQRLISAPMPRLKEAQYWILETILLKIPVHAAAHGFLPAHSIVSNATPHVGKQVVINLDLKDFFPTITYQRVKGLFRKMGYAEAIATPLALICTEPDVDEVTLDKETFYIANGERHLPQGAPTSPAITNVLCRKLDKRLAGLAARLGFTYTRYADDLTFSALDEGMKQVNKIKVLVGRIVEDEGFLVHPDKTRVMRKGRRQEVTGIVVNDKPGVNRPTLRRFRALLHQIEKDGIGGKTWGNTPDVLAAIHGYANYVAMVDTKKGQGLQTKVAQIIEKHEPTFRKRPRKTYPKKASRFTRLTEKPAENSTGTDAASEESKKPWWKIW